MPAPVPDPAVDDAALERQRAGLGPGRQAVNVVVEAALDVLENLDLDIEPADLGEARDRQVVEADGEPEGLDRVGAVAGFRHLTPPPSRPGRPRCRGRPAPDRLRPSHTAPAPHPRARAARPEARRE